MNPLLILLKESSPEGSIAAEILGNKSIHELTLNERADVLRGLSCGGARQKGLRNLHEAGVITVLTTLEKTARCTESRKQLQEAIESMLEHSKDAPIHIQEADVKLIYQSQGIVSGKSNELLTSEVKNEQRFYRAFEQLLRFWFLDNSPPKN